MIESKSQQIYSNLKVKHRLTFILIYIRGFRLCALLVKRNQKTEGFILTENINLRLSLILIVPQKIWKEGSMELKSFKIKNAQLKGRSL
mgnify:FL=1